jgi:hypothetical protein
MEDLLSFRKMITPVLIQILFWLGILVVVTVGLVLVVGGALLQGLGLLIFGPIVVRVYCELTIVIFKIHEALETIRDNQSQGPGT